MNAQLRKPSTSLCSCDTACSDGCKSSEAGKILSCRLVGALCASIAIAYSHSAIAAADPATRNVGVKKGPEPKALSPEELEILNQKIRDRLPALSGARSTAKKGEVPVDEVRQLDAIQVEGKRIEPEDYVAPKKSPIQLMRAELDTLLESPKLTEGYGADGSRYACYGDARRKFCISEKTGQVDSAGIAGRTGLLPKR